MKTLLLIFLVTGMAGGMSAWGEEDGTGLSEEVREAMRWYDSRGYPAVKGLQRVKVTASWSSKARGQKWETAQGGWLLEEGRKGWRIFTEAYAGKPVNPGGTLPMEESLVSEHEEVKKGIRSRTEIRKVDFKAEAETMRGKLKAGDKARVSSRTKVFVMGRDCLEQGLTETGTELLKQASRLRGQGTLLRSLKDEAARCAVGRLINQFGMPSISREAILSKAEAVLQEFADSEESIKELKTVVERLRVMVREDRDHAAAVKPFEAMTEKEQAAELVFRLRDQHGPYRWSTDESPEDPSSPAARLVKMGPAAVPALMEALRSDRYSRSVAINQGGPNPYDWIVTVDFCAQDALERIARRKFYGREQLKEETYATALRRDVEEWWRMFQEKRERQALIDAKDAEKRRARKSR